MRAIFSSRMENHNRMSERQRTRRYQYLIACVAFLFSLSGCMRGQEPVLRIGTNVWIGGEPLYLSRELGFLSSGEVQLVEYPSASEVLCAFRNQAIDGMVISLDELFELAADGLQPRIILVVDVSHGADAVVGRRGMLTMNDLKGKRVAVESGALLLDPALTLEGTQPTTPTTTAAATPTAAVQTVTTV